MPIPIFKAGDRVLIAKGTPVHSTGKAGNKVAARAYTVVVHHTLSGCSLPVAQAVRDDWARQQLVTQGVDIAELEALELDSPADFYAREILIQPAMVVWVGGGGYWCQTSQYNVTRAPQLP